MVSAGRDMRRKEEEASNRNLGPIGPRASQEWTARRTDGGWRRVVKEEHGAGEEEEDEKATQHKNVMRRRENGSEHNWFAWMCV